MNVGIQTFEWFHNKKDIGSSRIRADWLIKHWGDAERYVVGKKYDVIIFQKVYWLEYAKAFDGLKILDLCDGDFLDWACRLKEMLDLVDGVVCGTEMLAKVVRQMTEKPVIVIPDRMDLDSHKQKKVHVGEAKKVVWFGYSHNQKALESTLPFIEKKRLDLIVISNQPFVLPITYIGRINLTNYLWNIATVNDDIIKGDMVINPQYKYGNWQFKSNNKTLTAWALGMPVAETPDEVEKFMDENERRIEALRRQMEMKEKWDVRLSVKEYKDFIDFLYQKEIMQHVSH